MTNSIVPLMHCRNMARSVQFYTTILDFTLPGTRPENESPSFSILQRAGNELHISSHCGDGVFGNVCAIISDDVNRLFSLFVRNGLRIPPAGDSPVHHSPVDQTWGTREFYVDDPDGNTIRFIQRKTAAF
jgi:catechol 2,3-dioxygenase-like lactoylglutathione lyase family enzyme